jgi:hypothetical protein
MAGVKPRNLCRSLYMKQEILPLNCGLIFLLMNLIINNLELIQTNSTIYSVYTRNKNHLHRPITNLSCFQKVAYCTGVRIFSSLSPSPKTILGKKEKFKVVLRRYLNTHTFYSVNEFRQFKKDS